MKEKARYMENNLVKKLGKDHDTAVVDTAIRTLNTFEEISAFYRGYIKILQKDPELQKSIGAYAIEQAGVDCLKRLLLERHGWSDERTFKWGKAILPLGKDLEKSMGPSDLKRFKSYDANKPLYLQ